MAITIPRRPCLLHGRGGIEVIPVFSIMAGPRSLTNAAPQCTLALP